jgi:hypothetical protein
VTAADSPGPMGRTPRQVAGPTVEPEREDDAGESSVVDLRERPEPDPDPSADADPDPEVEPAPSVDADPDPEVEPAPSVDADPEVEPEATGDVDPEVEPEPESATDPDLQVELGPGFMGETSELHRRWEAVQASFVDDPRRAVEQADEMVSVAVAALQAYIEQQREDLAETWRGEQQASTDALLTAFQCYRELFEGVLST